MKMKINWDPANFFYSTQLKTQLSVKMLRITIKHTYHMKGFSIFQHLFQNFNELHLVAVFQVGWQQGLLVRVRGDDEERLLISADEINTSGESGRCSQEFF